MANNSGVQHQSAPQHFQQQQQNNSPHHCKECGLYLNSAESLEVHLQYHKENLLNKWATQAAASHSEETNNNNTKAINIKREFIPNNTVAPAINIKREFIPNNTVAAAADSSDSMHKKSPEYGSRATPEGIFGHPPTPQSYQSASSPYQNQENSAFSPNFQNYQIKTERSSPPVSSHYQNYHNYPDSQFFPLESNQPQYPQEYPVHKPPTYRYHPYQQSPYERPQPQSQVSSSSPAYPPQPTPSPSPKQCDKCGYVCESASQLIEHLNMTHPPTPAPHLANYQQSNQHFLFGADHQQVQIKTEEDNQSEILDLDSHKVHQVYPEEEKRQNGDVNGHNPHSVTAMLNSWPPQQQKMFAQEQQHAKMFQPHPVPNTDYMGNGTVTTTTQEPGSGMNSMTQQPPQTYRPFEHLPAQPTPPVISSTQVPTNPTQTSGPTTKAANWKSNEARRPKTYNCTACNKWFTSSGHLKRHYNTTLHKNAVKSSGHPDPATLPISAHHHPARESANREDTSGSPGEELRGEDTNSLPPQFERPNVPMPGLLQQPPNGPYDRQPAPPNIHHTPPLHSPMGHAPSPIPIGNPLVNPNALTNLSNGSPPNGEAGPSPNNIDSRGLLLSTTPNSMGSTPVPVHGYNMGHPMMPMESSQFQMYPNESAPHVTQATVTNSLSTTGEFQYVASSMTSDIQQPLPSFAQINTQRYGILLGYGNANVGGGGSVTTPYTSYYPDHYELSEVRSLSSRSEDDYKLAVLTVADPAPFSEDDLVIHYPSSPHYMLSPLPMSTINNIASEDSMIMSDCESKISTMEDIKIELDVQPSSPEKARFKRDYEDSSGASVVTSTVQVKLPGVHKCFECDKIFNKACYLTQHNKTFHSGDKPFKCSRCGKRFSNDTIYKQHQSKHAGEKPHKCDLCPKQFNHKTDLRRHMCLHTGQKPYACETCGKGFIRKDHMMKHCETHLRKAHSKQRS